MARKKTPHSSPKPPRKGGPDAKAEVMRLLAEGFTISAVAAQAGVDRKTVRVWRDSIEGQQLLDAARKARAAQFADAADQARRILREAAPRAAQRLVTRLGSKVPFEAITAADALLSRTGLPRTTKVETSPEEEYDLSQLSDEEQKALEALLGKAKRPT